MTIPFYKYQGTGNDFIIIDNRQGILTQYSDSLIQKLCKRRFGIGADGFMLMQNHAYYDFEVIYHNADGSKSLCGNGSRCAVHLAQYLNLINREAYFLTTDGPHQAYIKDNVVKLKMGDVSDIKPLHKGYFIHTGAPHYVTFVEDLKRLDVYKAGRTIRYSQAFQKQGTNVTFAEVANHDSLFVRTYEKGVEQETFSCGTGVTAAALAASLKGLQNPITINTKGGKLKVSFKVAGKDRFSTIYLTGSVARVFKGEIGI